VTPEPGAGEPVAELPAAVPVDDHAVGAEAPPSVADEPPVVIDAPLARADALPGARPGDEPEPEAEPGPDETARVEDAPAP
jgi:hypothetical protein